MNQGHCLTDVARAELRSRLPVGNAATSISRNGATGSCDVITAGNLSGNNWFNPVIQTSGALWRLLTHAIRT